VTAGTVALDLDGTLIDCRERQVAVARALVPALDGDRFWAAKRDGATTRAALEALGVAVADAAAAASGWAAAIEDDEWLALDAPLPGAVEALAALRAAGRRLVVVTARRRGDAVGPQLERLGLRALVDAVEVVSPRDPARGKAPILRTHAAAALIGDTESDAAAAAAAGVRFLAVGTGQRSPRFLAARALTPVYADVGAAARAL